MQGVHIRLADTKTGSNQSVEVRSPVVRELLRQLLNRVPEGRDQFLFPSTSQFRRCFKQACSYLGLSPAMCLTRFAMVVRRMTTSVA